PLLRVLTQPAYLSLDALRRALGIVNERGCTPSDVGGRVVALVTACVRIRNKDHRASQRSAFRQRRSARTHQYEVTLRDAVTDIIEEWRCVIPRRQCRRQFGGGGAHRIPVELAALMDDAQVTVALQQLSRAAQDSVVDAPRSLRATGDQHISQFI